MDISKQGVVGIKFPIAGNFENLEDVAQELDLPCPFQFYAIKGHGRLLVWATSSKFSKMIHFL